MENCWLWIQAFIRQRWVIWALFLCNLAGTIYGYYWYRNQLALTEPKILLPFVPDSPTASLFFTLVLFLLLLGRRAGFIAAFAAVTSVKYGIWAVVAILWGAALGDPLRPDHYMLMFSHAAMAIEAVLFYQAYRIRPVHILLVALWTLANDFFDYVLDIHPWVAPQLEVYDHLLGWFTLALSLFSLSVVAVLSLLPAKEWRIS